MVIDFIRNNITWIFSGVGVAIIGWLLQFGYSRWNEARVSAALAQKTPGYKVRRQPLRPKALTSRLPSFVLRAIFSPETVASKIKISLRGDKPFNIALSSEVQRVDIYFEFANLSPIDLILDRMLVDVWFNQPTFQQAILRRYFIPAGEITRDISLRQELNLAQVAQIQQYLADQNSSRVIRVYVTAYFESKAGRF